MSKTYRDNSIHIEETAENLTVCIRIWRISGYHWSVFCFNCTHNGVSGDKVKALRQLLQLYYVYFFQYPKQISKTLEFLQIFLRKYSSRSWNSINGDTCLQTAAFGTRAINENVEISTGNVLCVILKISLIRKKIDMQVVKPEMIYSSKSIINVRILKKKKIKQQNTLEPYICTMPHVERQYYE